MHACIPCTTGTMPFSSSGSLKLHKTRDERSDPGGFFHPAITKEYSSNQRDEIKKLVDIGSLQGWMTRLFAAVGSSKLHTTQENAIVSAQCN